MPAKLSFGGEIDRQHILPFGTTEDVKEGVARVANALFKPARTGCIAQCEWGKYDPKENIACVFEAWDTY